MIPRKPLPTYTAPANVRPTKEGYKQALECLPAHLRKRLEAKHEPTE